MYEYFNLFGLLAGFGMLIMTTGSGPTCQSNSTHISYSNGFLNVVFRYTFCKQRFPFDLQTHLLLPSTAMLARPAQTLVVCVFVVSPPCLTLPGVIMSLRINSVRSSLPSFNLSRDCICEGFSAFPCSFTVGQQSQRRLARQGQLVEYLAFLKQHLEESVYTSTVKHVEVESADICWETLPRIS